MRPGTVRTTNTRYSSVRVGDTLLAVDETGSGPVVLQAHGLGSSRGHHRDLGLDFPTLAMHHRVVRYDARGHGDSRGAPDPDHYVWPHLALDLLVIAARMSPREPVDVIGASMGVGAILHAALLVPEAFRRLVLIVPPAAWDTRAAQAAAYERAAILVERHGLGAFAAAGVMTARMPVPVLTGAGLRPQISADLLPAVLRGAARTDLPSLAALAQVSQPTLILPCTGDPAHPLSTAARLAEALPQATLMAPVPGPAQLVAWASTVEEFLAP